MRLSTKMGIFSVVTAGALTLSGCGAPTQVQSAASSPRASIATPSASIAAVVTRVVFTPTSMDLQDAAGNLVISYPYTADGSVVAAKMTEVLGSEPNEFPLDAGLEAFPGTRYAWPGFQINKEERPADKAQDRTFYVIVSEPSINGVEFVTPAGVKVGDPASSITQSAQDLWGPASYDGKTCVAEWVATAELALWICSFDADGTVQDFSVPIWLSV